MCYMNVNYSSGGNRQLWLLLLLFAPNVKGKWVDSNFQIIDLLVPPRAAGVAGTLIFVHIANFATLQHWLHVGSFTCRILIHYAQGTCTFMCPSATQSYVIKLSCSRKVRELNSASLGYNGPSQPR